MPAGVHIINKQVFELECMRSDHAFRVKERLGYDVQYQVEKIIDHACSRLSATGEDIRIPLLEINLGTISFDNLEKGIVSALEQQFFEKLAEQAGKRYGDDKVVFAATHSALEIMRTFLLTGQLPWFAGKQQQHYLPDLFDELLSGNSDELKRMILLNLGNTPFIERLSNQAGIKQLDHIVHLLELDEKLVNEVETAFVHIIEAIRLLAQAAVEKVKGTQDAFLMQEKNASHQHEAVKQVIEYLQNDVTVFAGFLRRITVEFMLKLASGKNSIAMEEQLFVLLTNMLAEKLDARPELLQPVLTKEKPYVQHLPEKISLIKDKLEESKIIAVQENQELTASEADSLKFYISNAGLILLASYLPVFFNELNLLEQGNFAGKSSQIKAVFLLHYLCTGVEFAPEYILPLNKVLCGLSLDEPLPSFVPLSEKEKEECEALLSEVITNWQRLGNSSIEGLREAFLNREGILLFENNGWKLHIERMGHDVLLESLPWSFGHTKLSWMQHLITTEW